MAEQKKDGKAQPEPASMVYITILHPCLQGLLLIHKSAVFPPTERLTSKSLTADSREHLDCMASKGSTKRGSGVDASTVGMDCASFQGDWPMLAASRNKRIRVKVAGRLGLEANWCCSIPTRYQHGAEQCDFLPSSFHIDADCCNNHPKGSAETLRYRGDVRD